MPVTMTVSLTTEYVRTGTDDAGHWRPATGEGRQEEREGGMR